MMKKIAVLYLRLLRENDLEDESGSISNQRTLLTSFAKKNGFRNRKIFVDDGVSGGYVQPTGIQSDVQND